MNDELVLLHSGSEQISQLLSDAQQWLQTPVGTPLPNNMTLQEWEVYGHSLRSNNDHLQWKLVDWLLHAERKWGNTYHQFADMTGLSLQTLREYVSVGERTLEERRPELGLGHHKLVASLPHHHQRTLLDMAVTGRWPRELMRQKVHDLKQILNAVPPTTQEPPLEADFTAEEVGDAPFVPNMTHPPEDVECHAEPETPQEQAPIETTERPAVNEQTWSTDAFARCRAIARAFDFNLRPEYFDPPRRPETVDDIVWCLCCMVRDADSTVAEMSTVADAGNQAHQANAALADEVTRLTAKLNAVQREYAMEKRRTTVTSPEGSETVHVAANDKPFLKAVVRTLEQTSEVAWDPSTAVGHALREYCSFLGIKVR